MGCLKIFKLDIDDFCEESFSFLESLSEGLDGHECEISAIDKNRAARIMSHAFEDFIFSKLEEK